MALPRSNSSKAAPAEARARKNSRQDRSTVLGPRQAPRRAAAPSSRSRQFSIEANHRPRLSPSG